MKSKCGVQKFKYDFIKTYIIFWYFLLFLWNEKKWERRQLRHWRGWPHSVFCLHHCRHLQQQEHLHSIPEYLECTKYTIYYLHILYSPKELIFIQFWSWVWILQVCTQRIGIPQMVNLAQKLSGLWSTICHGTWNQ